MRSTSGPGLLFVLVCAMGAGPVMNYGLSATSTLIMADLGISETQFGLLASTCFASAALSSMSLGRLSDRITARSQLAIIFGGTALALVLMAVSGNYLWLLAAVLLSGPAQAISNPTTNRVISHAVEPAKRPGWMGIKQSGVQASQLFSSLFFPAAALVAGWRGAAAGAAVVLALLLAYSWTRLPPEPRVPSTPKAERGPVDRRFPATVWLLAAFALFSGAGMQATNVYLPLFAQRELGFSLVMGGVAAAAAGVVGVASRVLWGRRMAEGVRASTLLLILAGGAIVGAGLLLAAGQTGNPLLLWAGVLFHGASVLGVNVVVMAGVLREVSQQRVGAASGAVSLGMYAGFAAGPLAMGLLLEFSGGFLGGWLAIGGFYLACVGIGLAYRRAGSSGRALKPLPAP
ncbi:MFS transporter [Arthrobacter caoxuetaonis]|uniref:MFS transporter n=1 Tax=Arthrobacter caoxuetaonis TaxID=2886935 RepID=A0A9X1SCD0_9MICC|nr:MFS transporter [Arthrobacter caoxuetaonis]MCC3298033.1 MFS transporter [Arthrobacter caoxuetaonis]USQ57046.1 MFS transporter [Arthrobacter caoxuetaonis]